MNNEDQLPTFPGFEELRNAGVQIRKGEDPLSRAYDMLERFLEVPNHAMFLFTSEDRIIDHHLRNHWAALDGLSSDACDIHVSLLQLQGDEDAYSQLREIRLIPGLAKFQPIELPALHIWSGSASVTLRLRRYDDETKLTDILRAVFTLVHLASGPIGEREVSQILDLANACCEKQVKQLNVYQEVYMGSQYNITGGQQGAVGDYAQASDFTQVWKAAASQIDLPALAAELGKLRGDLSKAASTPEHFVALGEIVAAETAAKEGNGPSVFQHLKKAGSWVWDVATKIGIGIATGAAKAALGL